MFLHRNFLDFFHKSQELELDCVLVEVKKTSGPTFAKENDIMLFNASLESQGCLGSPKLCEALGVLAKEALAQKTEKIFVNPSKDGAHGRSEFCLKPYFFEEGYKDLEARLRSIFWVVVFGSGEHTLPFLKLARFMGWNICLMDKRKEEQSLEYADRFILLEDSSDIFDLDLDSYHAAVILSHHTKDDANYLKGLSKSSLKYIGIMGNKISMQRMLEELNLAQDERIFAPIGLELGKGDIHTLALSICSQIESFKNKNF